MKTGCAIGWAVLIGCLAVTAGCGGKQIPFDQGVVTGNWQVKMVADVTGNQRNGGGFLGQVGQGVNGAFVLAGSCAGTGNVSGTVDRQSVTLKFGQTGQSLALTGLLSTDGSTMTGTYTNDVTTCGLIETGMWTATLVQPVQGSFNATFTSNQGAGPVHLVGTLTQQPKPNGGTLALITGPLTSTDSTCLVSPSGLPITLTGSITGTEIAFTAADPQNSGLGTFSGTVSPDAKTITVVDYKFGNVSANPPVICDSGNGTVTLQ
jgi:hypothetical protein